MVFWTDSRVIQVGEQQVRVLFLLLDMFVYHGEAVKSLQGESQQTEATLLMWGGCWDSQNRVTKGKVSLVIWRPEALELLVIFGWSKHVSIRFHPAPGGGASSQRQQWTQ